MNDEDNTIDRGEADVTAFDLLNLNKPTPFTEKLEKTYALEDEKTQGLARFITGLPLEAAGLVKSALIHPDFIKDTPLSILPFLIKYGSAPFIISTFFLFPNLRFIK